MAFAPSDPGLLNAVVDYIPPTGFAPSDRGVLNSDVYVGGSVVWGESDRGRRSVTVLDSRVWIKVGSQARQAAGVWVRENGTWRPVELH